MKLKKLSIPYAIWILFFIVFPLFLIVYYSVTTGSLRDFSNPQFSLEYFHRFFTSKYVKVLLNSIRLAFISTVICLLIGYPTAYFISKVDKKYKAVLMLMIVIPMWMNFLLRTYAWIILTGKNGIINSMLIHFGFSPIKMLYTEGASLMGMVYNFLPFMILPIFSILDKSDYSLVEASYDLGASKLQTFLRVVFPMSLPGVITGITMVFIPAISTFEISALLGGNKYNLIGNIIEHQFRIAGNWHYGSAISVVLIIMILISLAFTNEKGE